MRKLFRMKYESCSGQCYDHDDVMQIHSLGLDAQGAAAFLRRLLAMHEPSCGNPHIAFSLDVEDSLPNQPTVYVAAMQRYGALDLHLGATALEAMNKLIDGALVWYGSVEYQVIASQAVGAGRALCHHGEDGALLEFAISWSGLPPPEQLALRAQFAS